MDVGGGWVVAGWLLSSCEGQARDDSVWKRLRSASHIRLNPIHRASMGPLGRKRLDCLSPLHEDCIGASIYRSTSASCLSAARRFAHGRIYSSRRVMGKLLQRRRVEKATCSTVVCRMYCTPDRLFCNRKPKPNTTRQNAHLLTPVIESTSIDACLTRSIIPQEHSSNGTIHQPFRPL